MWPSPTPASTNVRSARSRSWVVSSPWTSLCRRCFIHSSYLLSVHLLQVSIHGEPDIFLRAGSPGRLECIVTEFAIPPTEVEWKFKGHSIDKRKYSRLSQKLNRNSSHGQRGVHLQRLSSKLRVTDEGEYSCHVGGVKATVRVTRTDGELRLPVKTGKANIRWRTDLIFLLIWGCNNV